MAGCSWTFRARSGRQLVELEVVSVGSIAEASPQSAGAFDEAEADTAVGPIIAEDSTWSSLSSRAVERRRPSGPGSGQQRRHRFPDHFDRYRGRLRAAHTT